MSIGQQNLSQDNGIIVCLVMSCVDKRDRTFPCQVAQSVEFIAMRWISAEYRRRNSSQRAGSCPNHFRSSVLGASSFTQWSIAASVFLTPRGQSRSTSTRVPSSAVGLSYACFSFTFSLEIFDSSTSFPHFRCF